MVVHAEDNSSTVPGNPTYTEDAFYYSDQYMWKVSLFVAKSDTVNKDTSQMNDFYQIGNQAIYLNPVKNMSQWTGGARPSSISGLFFSKENKVNTLLELQSKEGDVNAIDPIQITTGNNVNMITGVPNLPYVPQLSDGDIYDNGVIDSLKVGNITTVANYFNSLDTINTILNFYAGKQGVSRGELAQGFEFTIDGETRTGWNPEGILPDALNDNPTNQVEWLLVYEPVSIVYVKDTAHPGSYYGYALSATDFAVSQIKHQMDWRYDETRWTDWSGQQPDAWKSNEDRQHVSRLAFLLMGNSVITTSSWYGLESGVGVDQNAAIPFNRWFSDQEVRYGGWGMTRWIKPTEYEKPRDNDYRPNTDVILNTPVYANINATPGSELTVTYKINGDVIGTDALVAPIKTESYSYLKWHTPDVDTVTSYDLEMVISPYPQGTINCGGNEYTHRVLTVRPLKENIPPDPKVDDTKPTDLPDHLVTPSSIPGEDTTDETIAPVVKSVTAVTQAPYYKNETVKIEVVTNRAAKNLNFTNSDSGNGKQLAADSLGDGILMHRLVNELANEITWTIEFVPANLGVNHYRFKALNSDAGESEDYAFDIEVIIDPDAPEIYDVTITPLQSIYTLYAETASPPLQYMLIYDTDGGLEMESVMVDYNQTIDETDDPEKEGYLFKEWYKDNTFTEKWDFSTDKIMGVTTLYAKWEINTYTVKFDLNGKGDAISSMVTFYNENIEQPDDPEATGSVFDGWSTNASLTDSWDFDVDTVTNNMTLYAKWTTLEYVALFEENGGSLVDDVKQDYGTKLMEPVTDRLGYSVEGWYQDSTFTVTWDFSSDTLTDSITLYVKWIADDAFIEFNTNGGTDVLKMTGTTDLIIDPTTLPTSTRSGYTLEGWHDNEGLSDEALTKLPDVYPAGTTIYYAKWTANVSTISFDTTGGSAVADYIGVTDQVITDKTMPTTTLDGYTQEGWYASADLSGAKITELPDQYPVDGVTYYAKWTANVSTISFDTTGGSAIADYVGVTDQVIIDKTMPTTTRDGYTKEGWYASADLSGAKITELPDQYPVDGVTYYAKWTANVSTISFDTTGGSAVADYIGVTDQVITDKTMPTTTRDGYTKEGWYASADLSGAKVTELPDQYPIDGVTYYAKWTANPSTIKFETNDGSLVPDMVGVTDQVISPTILPTTSRIGYTFDGFFTDENFNSETKITTLPNKYPIDGVTYYAKWMINSYTITYNSVGGSNVPFIMADYNTTIIESSSTKTGYTLIGWFKDSACTDEWVFATDKVTNDMTLYAKWMKISSTSIDLPESSNATQTHILDLDDSYDFYSMTSDQGDLNLISVDNNQIEVELSGGTSHRTGIISGSYNTTSTTKTTTHTSQGSNTTPSSVYYSNNGYCGTLNKESTTTNKVQTGGSYVPDDTKTKTATRTSQGSPTPSSVYYSNNGYRGTLNKKSTTTNKVQTGGSYVPDDTKTEAATRTSQGSNTTPSKIYYSSDGYYGTLNKKTTTTNKVQTGGSYVPDDTKYVTHHHEELVNPSSYPLLARHYSSLGYEGTIYRLSIYAKNGVYYVEYGGMATKTGHDTRTYRTDYTSTYKGTVTKSGHDTRTYRTDYTSKYRGTVTKPGSDTRTYRTDYTSNYSGTVTKFISDTRVYGPYYKYTVTINYTEK
jgi:uncharacterized repeat protein (TIGR02543 family)